MCPTAEIAIYDWAQIILRIRFRSRLGTNGSIQDLAILSPTSDMGREARRSLSFAAKSASE
jgi:hypothetical protein